VGPKAKLRRGPKNIVGNPPKFWSATPMVVSVSKKGNTNGNILSLSNN